jgi:hypothetical protein
LTSPARQIVQPNLTANAPGDQYEQEADRVADAVMQMPEPAVSLSWLGLDGLLPQAPTVGRLPAISRLQTSGDGAFEVSPEIEANINHMRGGGQALPADEQTFFEARMGYDFSNVRVHTDTNAVQTSQALSARAFTVGHDIAFNQGAYQPGTDAGRRLLAHELTHVVQQGAAGVQRKPRLGRSQQSQVLRHLQALQQQPDFNRSLYRREIAEFQRTHSAEQLVARQEQILAGRESADIRERDLSQTLRRNGGTKTPKVKKAVLTPVDNFTGRSKKKFGVGEEIKLSYVSAPANAAAALGGLRWSIAAGKGTLTPNVPANNDGQATFTADKDSGSVRLNLSIAGGANANKVLKKVKITVVKPSGAVMEQEPGTGILHRTGKAGVGFEGRTYLRPKNVSFSNIETREGECTGTGTGHLKYQDGLKHNTGIWLTIGTGNISKGCHENSVDTVDTGDYKGPPFAYGTFVWPIPWQYRVGSSAAKTFTTANHEERIYKSGKTKIRKAGSPWFKGPYP